MCIFNTSCECGIASRLRTSNRLKSQFGPGSGKIDTALVDQDPVTRGREISSSVGNEGRGAYSSKPITRGKQIVPTMDSKNKKRKKTRMEKTLGLK